MTQADGANLPTWLGFTPATRTFTGTPAASDVETVSVKVTANDSNGGLVSDVFDIVVRAANNPISSTNNPPTVATAIPDQTATTGAAFNYAFPDTTFTDADTLSYTATQSDGANLPIWLTFTPATRAFTGTPMVTDAQTFTVKVTASDPNSATVSDEFEIIVSAAPVVITHCNATDPNELWCAGLTVGTGASGGGYRIRLQERVANVVGRTDRR